ncbi:uncharacterized protein LOC129973198 [Argiope bruennichi]|uniref:uncharacterized protein LOC129973198 n=1 Tax=Argiope bruennichi TaxID=94029 RepID=UPI002494C481|nr:uncharacterized protein LOC129973198 [Argiope bruennichi]
MAPKKWRIFFNPLAHFTRIGAFPRVLTGRRDNPKAEVIFKGKKLNIAPAVKKQNYRSETSEIFWNSPDSSIVEQETTRKNYMIYSEISDYPGITRYEIPANTYESPNAYIQGGLNFSVTDLQYAYGSPQMNILPYPTLVYLPQQAFHCPGTVSYPINSAFPEIIPILPTPLCCMNESR